VGRPNDTVEDAVAALAYLNRSNRARPVGDGFWLHLDFISPAASPFNPLQTERREEGVES
jgi:hypothetical protein